MLGKFLAGLGGSLGGAIGNALGGGIFSTLGRYAGSWLGNYLGNSKKKPQKKRSNAKNHEINYSYNIQNIKDNFNFTRAVYGEAIPLIFGSNKVNAKIIWAKQIKQVRINSTEQKYFSNNTIKSVNFIISYEYYFSFALSLCEGEIAEIGRVWANDELIDLGNYKFRLYLGSEEQNPDPLILEDSQNQAPAFRNQAYIVFEDLPLADFNDSIPFFSFEVVRKANIPALFSVEDMVHSMVIIPGSGEYVYDTITQYKITRNENGNEVDRSVINSHNYKKLPNSIHSLNQLNLTCSNVEWVAPVVCWFGDSLDTANCRIRPGIEFNEPNIDYSETWQVGSYTRSNAMIVSRDELGNPVYGGSINDASLLRYLEELRSRNLKIMFYPMFLMDVPGKPWRGHLTGQPSSVAEFFTKQEGYNKFILHYANLVRDHVDAFVIGSELIGLTKVRDGQNFPGVDELTKLVELVKQVVGEVKTIYAADWSEYHHTTGSWYNLDPLWASVYLDYIGIDAYFPVTRSSSSNILPNEIIEGWQSGEGYDFYYDHNSVKQPLQAAYAWKNIRYWWENFHYNPDGNQTSWQPKMKKIWFTEFGFPSIDKSTNQPNIFFDPKCTDGGVPIYSTGEANLSIQRRAIKMFIEFWQTQEYIEQLFLWTWDARPYPAWPHMNIWRDGNLWEKGHWVNNKFGAANLASILLELSKRAGIDIKNIDVSTLDESVEGLIFKNQQTIIDAINTLRIAFFFDITTINTEQIKFIKRGQTKSYKIDKKLLIKLNDNSFFEKKEIPHDQILSKLEIYFIDHVNVFNYGYCQVNSENLSNHNNICIQLPICMSSGHAETIGNLILKNALIEDQMIKFKLPLNGFEYEPTDHISLTYRDYNYQIRIISIEIKELILEIIGIFDDAESYAQLITNSSYHIDSNYSLPLDNKLCLVELPFNLARESNPHYFIAYLRSDHDLPLYGSLFPNNPQPHKITNLSSGACIGKVISFTNAKEANIFLIDEISTFTLSSVNFASAVSTGWNLILIGKEIIHFSSWKTLSDNRYQISSLIRGKFCTDEYMHDHNDNDEFILLSVKPNLITLSDTVIGKTIYFKARNLDEININFTGKLIKPASPYIISCEIQNESLTLVWQTRLTEEDDWINPEIIPKYEFVIDVLPLDISPQKSAAQFNTIDNILTINLTKIGLSGRLRVSIMAKDELGNISLPSSKILSI